MVNLSVRSAIRLRGVRHNNLKNFDLDLPLNQLIVITGLSGSGKSSLAFDTLFAEGQRRYIETFSPYARQFLDRMDKPQVDAIEGIPPAIAIEQRNAVKTTRSTVGTMTEICDYMKVLWSHIAQLHCRQCGQPVRKDSPQQVWDSLRSRPASGEFLVTFELPLTEKLSLADSLGLVSKQGYQRLLLGGKITRLDEVPSVISPGDKRPNSLSIVQDRLKCSDANRPRFIEACEQAYHFGKGKLTIWSVGPASAIAEPQPFSNRLHCARCDIEYREASPALFSFNHPVGACPTCRGFGRVISIDYNRAIPDRSKTLAEGVVRPWKTGHGVESQDDLMRACKELEIPTNVPFSKLRKKWQTFVIEGEPGYGTDEEHEWPRAWYGVKGYFRWLESKAYKMHIRVLLSRYRAYTRCPACQGKRFQPEALLYRAALGLNHDPSRATAALEPKAQNPREVNGKANGNAPEAPVETWATLADFYQLAIRDAAQLVESLVKRLAVPAHDPLGTALNEVSARLGFLCEVGLGYLTLDRPTRSLSGGETERVSLTTCLGTRLVNTLFVLDEPSVGLHPRDTERLVRILERLRDAGNTVVVVEHEASVMKAANQIVDLGPGHGAEGGQVVFQGTYKEILSSAPSLTGQYLSGRKEVPVPERRPVGLDNHSRGDVSRSFNSPVLNEAIVPYRPGSSTKTSAPPSLKISHASQNNLDDLSVEIPLKRLVCITGVSGSGKTTLVREVLLPSLAAKLSLEGFASKTSDRSESDANEKEEESESGSPQSAFLEGAEHLERVVLVDQSILGKTPRSNPAVYIGAFDDIRELFAQSEIARQRGLNASAFSFNSAQGQCERCRGAGFEKIEMQFLSDVFIRCPDCDGRRYRAHILEIQIRPEPQVPGATTGAASDRLPAAKLSSRGQRKQKRTAPRIEPQKGSRALSIGDVLDATVDEVVAFLTGFENSRPAERAIQSLRWLQDVGLGYLRLGQPINTLSGGESQRLKLVRHLAEASVGAGAQVSTLFLFDEPTTGLHFDDVRVLVQVFQRLVEAGHSLVIIEHNLDLIKAADWIIDLGPEAGDQGGQVIAQGTPEEVAGCPDSHTGRSLAEVLGARKRSGMSTERSRGKKRAGLLSSKQA